MASPYRWGQRRRRHPGPGALPCERPVAARDSGLVRAPAPAAVRDRKGATVLFQDVARISTAIGFIALAGVAAEFGVVILVYLQNAWRQRLAAGEPDNEETLLAVIRQGAVMRVRPKAMTMAVVRACLLPIPFGHGTGSEVMTRIAAPMVGGIPIAFEVQLSTTYLNVTAQRREFYRQEGGLLFWVFSQFSMDARRLTQDDVFYNNNRNAFVLTSETRDRSVRQKRFMLECVWAEPTADGGVEALQRETVPFD